MAKKALQLYDYQEEMLTRIEVAFLEHRAVMAQMPTGTGKTVLLAGFLARHAEHHVLIVAHRRELVEQIEATVHLFSEQAPALSSKVQVASIQWLNKHYEDIKEKPTLVVIDEAHHALARTYKYMWTQFPDAKFLGLTATPYRLNGKGFTDLFDTLICSHSVIDFIRQGRLALFDFVSIAPDSETQTLISSLKKRGTDGDFQTKEMDEVLNQLTSIERLYQSIATYAKGKKGIVYAIDIAHAQNIVEYYRSKGLRAVSIDSHTPAKERKALIDQFKVGQLDILINVDIFSEGFDCPDVEFIQLARPTLSLAKYLQMVGRGLRVAKGKDACVIIDNVGLYKSFGLPTRPWDWQAMFEGVFNKRSEYADVPTYTFLSHGSGGDSEMEKVASYDLLLKMMDKEDELYQLRKKIAERRERLLAKGEGTNFRCLRSQLATYTNSNVERVYVDLRTMRKFFFSLEGSIHTEGSGVLQVLKSGPNYYTRTLKKWDYSKRYVSSCRYHDYGFYAIIGDDKFDYYIEAYEKYLKGDLTIDELLKYNFQETAPSGLRWIYRIKATPCLLACDDSETFLFMGKISDDAILVQDSDDRLFFVSRERGKRLLAIDRKNLTEKECDELLKGLYMEEVRRKRNILQRHEAEKVLREKGELSIELFCERGKWGLRTSEGRLLLAPKYKEIEPSPDDLFLIQTTKGEYGVVDAAGQILVPAKYKFIRIDSAEHVCLYTSTMPLMMSIVNLKKKR